jgi:hypothetical protein
MMEVIGHNLTFLDGACSHRSVLGGAVALCPPLPSASGSSGEDTSVRRDADPFDGSCIKSVGGEPGGSLGSGDALIFLRSFAFLAF